MNIYFNRLVERITLFGSYPDSEVKLYSLLNKKRPSNFKEVKLESLFGVSIILREGFFPVYEMYKDNSCITYYNMKNEIHRDNDLPAFLIVKKEIVYHEEYYKKGLRHRDSGLPTVIKYKRFSSYDPSMKISKIIEKEYYQLGLLHRDNLPARVKILYLKDDGDIYKFLKIQEYYQFGLLHRDNLPARIKNRYYKITEEYYQFGLLHRDNHPAKIRYNVDDSKYLVYEEYYQFGLLHRDNLPSRIEY